MLIHKDLSFSKRERWAIRFWDFTEEGSRLIEWLSVLTEVGAFEFWGGGDNTTGDVFDSKGWVRQDCKAKASSKRESNRTVSKSSQSSRGVARFRPIRPPESGCCHWENHAGAAL